MLVCLFVIWLLPICYAAVTIVLRDKVFPWFLKNKKKFRPTDPTDCSTVSRTTNFFFFGLSFKFGKRELIHLALRGRSLLFRNNCPEHFVSKLKGDSRGIKIFQDFALKFSQMYMYIRKLQRKLIVKDNFWGELKRCQFFLDKVSEIKGLKKYGLASKHS